MKIATIIVRVLLGLMFVVFGSNAFLKFMPMPELPQNPAGDFIRSLAASGYIYAIGAFQVAGGACLLLGRYVPLGLTLLGPIIVAVLSLFLLWRYREAFAGLVRR